MNQSSPFLRPPRKWWRGHLCFSAVGESRRGRNIWDSPDWGDTFRSCCDCGVVSPRYLWHVPNIPCHHRSPAGYFSCASTKPRQQVKAQWLQTRAKVSQPQSLCCFTGKWTTFAALQESEQQACWHEELKELIINRNVLLTLPNTLPGPQGKGVSAVSVPFLSHCLPSPFFSFK